MGSNRNEYNKQPASKVSVDIRNEFRINITDIYSAWCDYSEMRLDGVTKYDAVQAMKKNHSEAVLDYFIAMTLELIDNEMINGSKNAPKK